MAYRLPGNITRGMHVSADSPTRSVRFAPPPSASGGPWAARDPGAPCQEPRLIGTGTRLMGEDALSGRDADALLVSARLLGDRRASLRRPDTSRQRQHLRGNGFRQVWHDQWRG